jgi:aminomethyltransferase
MLDAYFSDRRVEQLKVDGSATVPLRFSDARTEHRATRSSAGLFDFSFMSLFEVSGPQARAYLERVQTRRLSQLAPGRLFYTLLLREDGSVFNDATLWCLAPERYWLFTGRRSDHAWLEQWRQAGEPQLANLSGQYAILALQGPRSFDVLRRARAAALDGLRYFAFSDANLAGASARIGRLGYSGELGCEILLPAAAGVRAWNGLLEVGAAEGLRECGFEAANSLRVESGYILFTNELAAGADPFELGLARLVTSGACIGAAALRARRWRGTLRRLVGLVPTGSRRASGDLPAAQLTSEAYSPVSGRLLGMGFAPAADAGPGNLLRLADGRLARSARLPYYDPLRLLPRCL